MVLVDTSVLIPILKNTRTAETEKFDEIVERGIPYGICNYVYQELLQGVRTENQFELLKDYLDTQRFYDLKDGRESYAKAAKMFYKCQKAGIILRKGIDLLIAQIAIENNLRLLHNDKDFAQLMTVEKRLRPY
jgi:predicted nucleic acid-binding protein